MILIPYNEDILTTNYSKWRAKRTYQCKTMEQSYVKSNSKKVSPESERYEECLFGYSRIVHTDICTFTLVFSHGDKSRA